MKVRFFVLPVLLLLGAVLSFTQGCENDDDTIITLSEYNEIEIGMSYDEVVAIVGDGPTRTASATGPYENTGTAYQWINDDGSSAVITFENDKVVLKAQVDLK